MRTGLGDADPRTNPSIGLTVVTSIIRIRTHARPRNWSQTPARACVGRSKLSHYRAPMCAGVRGHRQVEHPVIAKSLATLWNTVCSAVLELGRSRLLADATGLDGMTTIGVDEHCWSHRGYDRWVTVISLLASVPEC